MIYLRLLAILMHGGGFSHSFCRAFGFSVVAGLMPTTNRTETVHQPP